VHALESAHVHGFAHGGHSRLGKGAGSTYDSCASGGHFRKRERERERESQVPVGDRDCPAFYHILLYMRERLSLSLSLSLSFSLFWRLLAHSRRGGGVFESSNLPRARSISLFSSITETRPGPQFRRPSLLDRQAPSLSLSLFALPSHNGLAVGRISEGIRAARL
jgi:hypothetical protein